MAPTRFRALWDDVIVPSLFLAGTAVMLACIAAPFLVR